LLAATTSRRTSARVGSVPSPAESAYRVGGSLVSRDHFPRRAPLGARCLSGGEIASDSDRGGSDRAACNAPRREMFIPETTSATSWVPERPRQLDFSKPDDDEPDQRTLGEIVRDELPPEAATLLRVRGAQVAAGMTRMEALTRAIRTGKVRPRPMAARRPTTCAGGRGRAPRLAANTRRRGSRRRTSSRSAAGGDDPPPPSDPPPELARPAA
jgi:hypothetical protein